MKIFIGIILSFSLILNCAPFKDSDLDPNSVFSTLIGLQLLSDLSNGNVRTVINFKLTNTGGTAYGSSSETLVYGGTTQLGEADPNTGSIYSLQYEKSVNFREFAKYPGEVEAVLRGYGYNTYQVRNSSGAVLGSFILKIGRNMSTETKDRVVIEGLVGDVAPEILSIDQETIPSDSLAIDSFRLLGERDGRIFAFGMNQIVSQNNQELSTASLLTSVDGKNFRAIEISNPELNYSKEMYPSGYFPRFEASNVIKVGPDDYFFLIQKNTFNTGSGFYDIFAWYGVRITGSSVKEVYRVYPVNSGPIYVERIFYMQNELIYGELYGSLDFRKDTNFLKTGSSASVVSPNINSPSLPRTDYVHEYQGGIVYSDNTNPMVNIYSANGFVSQSTISNVSSLSTLNDSAFLIGNSGGYVFYRDPTPPFLVQVHKITNPMFTTGVVSSNLVNSFSSPLSLVTTQVRTKGIREFGGSKSVSVIETFNNMSLFVENANTWSYVNLNGALDIKNEVEFRDHFQEFGNELFYLRQRNYQTDKPDIQIFRSSNGNDWSKYERVNVTR
jgi:hypothetical protein